MNTYYDDYYFNDYDDDNQYPYPNFKKFTYVTDTEYTEWHRFKKDRCMPTGCMFSKGNDLLNYSKTHLPEVYATYKYIYKISRINSSRIMILDSYHEALYFARTFMIKPETHYSDSDDDYVCNSLVEIDWPKVKHVYTGIYCPYLLYAEHKWRMPEFTALINVDTLIVWKLDILKLELAYVRKK